jgi:hypothetical protein
MFPGGASASAGDVPALHCLRVHAPHLGQVQQGLEREREEHRGSNPGPPIVHLKKFICVLVYPLAIGLFLFTFIVLNLAPFFYEIYFFFQTVLN